MEPTEHMEKAPHPRQTNQPLDVLILAAGLGTRMKSARAKVLHELGGSPLIAYVCRAARALAPEKIYVVVGHQAAEVEKAVRNEVEGIAEFVTQTEQRGTGDAVMAAKAQLENTDSLVLILSGDVPLIRAETFHRPPSIEWRRVLDSLCAAGKSDGLRAGNPQ
jgi:bifunctional UDP-N-acetylglucosamine pyrophosphorylase/glucosamine-1-phosphate N-acetyltransferase